MNSYLFSLFAWPFLISFLVAFLATPLVIKLAWKLKLVDDPTRNRQAKTTHTYPVPRGGGLPIILALLVAAFLFLPLDKHLVGILAGALLASLVGLLDDRFNLNPYFRLLTCFLAAGAVAAAGIGIAFISNPLGGIFDLSGVRISFFFWGEERTIWVLSALFAFVWITWCMNFIGWAGGIEGQLPGLVVIAALTIGALSLRFGADITQWPVLILTSITAGAYLGFLPFNFYPQKIMPGYGGKSLAGFLLGVLSLLATAKVGTLMLVLAIPLIDAFYSIARRILAKKSPVWGDRGHLHHRLLDLGLSKRKIVFLYWTITLFLGILALNLNSQQKFYTMIMLTLILGGFFLWLAYFTKSRFPHDQSSG